MNIIKAYRERTGMKQKELAAVVGVSTSAVAMWEIGKRFPRPQHIPTLARVPVSYTHLFAKNARDASRFRREDGGTEYAGCAL